MKEEAIEWNNKGVTHFLKKNWEQAAECFSKARDADPRNPAVWNNFGLLAHQQKEYKNAVEFFRKANAVDKKPTYLVNEGNSLAMLGKYAEAQSSYQEALDMDPTAENALLSMAKLNIHLCRHQQAAFFLEKLVRTYQKASHYYELSVVYLDMGKVSEALQMLYSLAEKTPSPFTNFQIGRGEFISKNYGIAETYFKQALAEIPDHKSFRHYLALTYLTMGNVDEGLRQLELVLRLYPDDYEILTEKGVVLCGLQDFKGAMSCFVKALHVKPDFAKAIRYKDLISNNNQKIH
jgi:tetratricopeptide (TPR) repeat protein